MDAARQESQEGSSSWLPHLLQTTDSIFPTGSYAHSFGLEGVVQAGLVSDTAGLKAFLKEFILPALERAELPFVAFAYRAAAAKDVVKLQRLDQQYGAMKGARELRFASARIGSQRLNMLLQIAPHPILQSLEQARLRGEVEAHAAIVFGAQAAVCGMPVSAALTAYYYQALASLSSASMKLIRIGQSACQGMLAELLVESVAICARSLLITESEAGWFLPTLDIASAQHENAYTRLFIS